ncbi:MAG: ABC transporter ATP-binding protein [Chloroflexota bacterium]
MQTETVIQTNNIWKRYGLPFMPRLRRAFDQWRQQEKSIEAYGPWSLRDVSFDVKHGETVGIIGHNGAGKSTLLKILAGVTPATEGEMLVSGRIFPMIELNAGLHTELTGRQNVYMLGAVMGLQRSEIRDRIERIKEFSELDEWFERPIRKYSSGMLTRLGFSVAINVDADLLLIDEVLSVGDITFQRKCFDHMEKLQADNNTSIIFVSHGIRQVERLCERTLMLDKGEVLAFGDTKDIISEYYSHSNKGIIEHRIKGQDVQGRYYDNTIIHVPQVRLLDKNGNESNEFETGEQITIAIDYEADELHEAVIFGLGIATVDSFYLSGMTSEETELYDLQGTGTIYCTIDNLPLLNGIYTVYVKLRKLWGGVLGGGESLAVFSVSSANVDLSNRFGVIRIASQWHTELHDIETQQKVR